MFGLHAYFMYLYVQSYIKRSWASIDCDWIKLKSRDSLPHRPAVLNLPSAVTP